MTAHETEQTTPSRAAADRKIHARALALIAEGNSSEGARALLELADAGSPCWEVYNDLAALAVTQDDLDAACDLLEVARTCQDAPPNVTLLLAQILAARGQAEQALAMLSPLLRGGDDGSALATIRDLLGTLHGPLSPVAWARLVNDLRAPTAEQKRKDERIVELERELRSTTDEARRLRAVADELRTELNLPRQPRNVTDLDSAWQRIRSLSDKDWLKALQRSIDIPSFDGFPMPGFPSEALQVGMVGSSNEAALREGMMFYRAVRDLCAQHHRQWTEKDRLLDFGTGWGRYARIFMKDFHPSNVVGIDVDESYIKGCRETFPYGSFETVPPLPPSHLPDAGFDLVIAYSVFSHLAEHAANAWIAEFARVLRPGGMVAVTTQGRGFLQVCEQMRSRENHEHPWHRNLARSFVDRAAAEAAYDAGEFLFSATGGGDVRPSTFYGEALVPPGYVERHWSDKFELLEYVDDRGFLPQALILLRKRNAQ